MIHPATIRAIVAALVAVALAGAAALAWVRFPWSLDVYMWTGGMAPLLVAYLILKLCALIVSYGEPRKAAAPIKVTPRRVAAVFFVAVYVAGACALWRLTWIGMAFYVLSSGIGPAALAVAVLYIAVRIWGLRRRRSA